MLETPGLAELPTISKHGGSGPDPPGLYRISGGAGAFAVPWLTAPRDEKEPWQLAFASTLSSRQAVGGSASCAPARSGYRARPALACIIGARRAWTAEMISSESIPCR